MARSDYTEPEWRSRAAGNPLQAFYDRLLAELDEEDGAFPSWEGGSDWRTLALIADYLLQSVSGTKQAIEAAALAAIDHKQALYSLNGDGRMAWVKGRTAGPDAYFWAVAGSPAARHKSQKVDVAIEHCFFHMGQALDRLAAAVLIVGGFSVDVSGPIYFSTLEAMHRAVQADKRRPPTVAPDKSIAPHGTRGRGLQTALLDPMSHINDFGPPGWLDWLRGTRNALTHRPSSTHIVVVERDGSVVRTLHRQPVLSDVQSLIHASQNPPAQVPGQRRPAALRNSVLDRRSDDILDGLLESLCSLIATFVDAMNGCWDARAAEPTALIQHGTQWPAMHLKGTTSPFDATTYGDPIRLDHGDTMAANPARPAVGVGVGGAGSEPERRRRDTAAAAVARNFRIFT